MATKSLGTTRQLIIAAGGLFKLATGAIFRWDGGNVGDVPTVQEDGRLALQAPSGSGLTSPLQIPDCALWLDASQLDLDDDDPVATWPDLSGEGNDATQAVSGNRPTFKAAAAAIPSTAQNSIYTIQVTATSGDFTLLADGYPGGPGGTDTIAFNADLAAVQAAFDYISGAGFWLVTGASLAAGLTVEAIGDLATLPVTLVIDTDTTDGTVAVVQVQLGDAGDPYVPAVGINGLPIVRFDGSDDFLSLLGDGLDLLRDVPGFTLVAVCSSSDSSGFIFSASDGGGNGVHRAGLRKDSLDVGLAEDEENDISRNDILMPPVLEGPMTVLGSADLNQVSSAGTVLTDGVFALSKPLTSTPGNTADTASDTITVGVDYDGVTGSFAGDIAELIVWPRHLNSVERRQLLEYLSTKWGTL